MSIHVLIRLVQDELSCLEYLWQALQDEYLALCQREVTNIDAAVSKKQNAMKCLEAIFQNYEEQLRASGLPSTLEGIDAYIQANASQGQEPLSTFWEQRQRRLQQCCDQNQLNGSLINRNRHQILQALTILSGQELKPAAYGPGGDLLPSASASRSLLGRV
ncbi:flagellar protein FlgN [Nitrosococcus wardiae]|uniref:Flagellar protein FlgN n=1 Tax=Nitrosococcus wardiae TaxID=1814290 RepID=A0A4P7BU21_9GAMM|nr:flagellar protein FlgN [Nitrosococcus wardiae]QBQ53351.1 flagellar protein FlgN [Nitrosococcus wardiae]